MLIYDTDHKRKLPSLAESLAQKKEETHKFNHSYRLEDHKELKQAEARVGKPMAHDELIKRVEKATGRKVWGEVSLRDPNVYGFYTTGQDGEKKYICAFEKGYLPEFSIVLVDDHDMPIKEKRGWRTVLTRLLQTKAIKYYQIRNAFEISDHLSDDRWRANTQRFKE